MSTLVSPSILHGNRVHDVAPRPHETFRPPRGCHGLREMGFMSDQSTALPTAITHGPTRLPSVDVDSYNAELKDDEGFLGDRASRGSARSSRTGASPCAMPTM